MARVTQAAVLLCAALAIAGVQAQSGAEKKCMALKECYPAGDTTVPCNPDMKVCPQCVVFSNSACYAPINGGCEFEFFSGTNCEEYFDARLNGETNAPSDTPASTPPATGPSENGSDGTTASDSENGEDNNTVEPNGSKESENKTGSEESESGADMGLVFAIIGGAIGVIAVAVIFLTLVRRSRAAQEDDDDIENDFGLNPAYKQKGTARASVGSAAFGTYSAQDKAPSSQPAPTGVSDYYNQAPPSKPSPRSVGLTQPVARPVAHRSRPNSRANSVEAGMHTSALPPGAAVLGSPAHASEYYPPSGHVAVPMDQGAHAGKMSASPRTRRESYEF